MWSPCIIKLVISFACKLICVQRICLSFAGVVISLYDPIGNPWIGM
jgi:hypothetical protein